MNDNPAVDHQQAAAKHINSALEAITAASRELEAIHPVAAMSAEFKELKAITTRLREAMMAVLQMKVR